MRPSVLAGGALLAVSLVAGVAAQSPLATSPFESYLELLRQQAGIPAISAAIVQNGEVVWERGLGYQNVDTRIRATPDTPYPISNLSGTLAATLVLQCVEERRVVLDEPAATYGVSLPDGGVTVRQLLTHAGSASSGESFRYDPDRFAQLGRVVETCVPQPYRKTIAVRLLEFLAMKDSVPGRDVQDDAVVDAEPVRRLGPAALSRRARARRPSLQGGQEGPRVAQHGAAPGKLECVGRGGFDRPRPGSFRRGTRQRRTAARGHARRGVDQCARSRLAADPDRAWLVRSAIQRPDCRLAVRPDDERLLVAHPPDPGEAPDPHPAGQQRWTQLYFDLASGDVTKSLFGVLFLRLFA